MKLMADILQIMNHLVLVGMPFVSNRHMHYSIHHIITTYILA